MRGLNKYHLILIFILCFGIGSKGQMVFDTLFLSELEVLGYKVDYLATTKGNTIDSLFKQSLNEHDLGELLSLYTPVFIRSYGKGSLATASFRGTGASHTQVLWNDFRLNSPMLGQTDFSLLPNSFFDEVELYYGGASLIKSGGGFGGGINLVNEPFHSGSPLVSLSQSYGSFNTWSSSAGLNIGNKKFVSNTRFIYQSSKNDFPYNNDAIIPPKEMKQEKADYRNVGFTQQFSYRPNLHHVLSFSTWNQWNFRNLPPLMTGVESSEGKKQYQDDVFTRNTLGWFFHKNRSKFELKAAYFYENYTYNLQNDSDGLPDAGDTLINSLNKTNSVFVKAKYEHSFQKGFELATGLDIDFESVHSNNYDGVKQRNTPGLFAQLKKDFWSRLKISFLLRAQMSDSEILPLMPLLGLNLKLLKNQDIYLRMSISRNYHLPTLNDLYWYPGGNENLKPEDGVETEAGFNYAFSAADHLLIKMDVTAYASKINNWIQWVDTGSGYWSPENINEVFARGVEFTAHLDGRVGKSNYRIYLEYAYTRTSNINEISNGINDRDDQLIYIPRHTANGLVRWSYRLFYINWNVHYVGEQNTIGNTLAAYLLNDIAIGKQWYFDKLGLETRFKVNNLFDVDYQAVLWRPMPGRNYEIFLSFKLNKNK